MKVIVQTRDTMYNAGFTMDIVVKCRLLDGNEITHVMNILEPYVISYDKWNVFLTEADSVIGIYSGSGGCVSHIERKNGKIRFVSEESGMGCDSTQTLTCSEKPVLDALRPVVEQLHDAGRI